MSAKKIKSALISVYYKDGLAPIVELLHQHGVQLYSTGGTQTFIEQMNIPVTAVEDLTSYPSIFGGRVKTLHPKVFGGILYRRDNEGDINTAAEFEIQAIDLVIVDLYPFNETVASGASDEDIIEKIDIGGISLIRAAAKNFEDVLIVSSRNQYAGVENLLKTQDCGTTLADRRRFATLAFGMSASYDTAINQWFAGITQAPAIPQNTASLPLRYGENPHQAARFYGNLEELFEQLHGKELSYNNLVDVEACVDLLDEFKEHTYVIIKHTNACGVATASTPLEAYLTALACDPTSAFGGVIATTSPVDLATAQELSKLFFEVLIAPSFDEDALSVLKTKKNRVLLKRKPAEMPTKMFKTLLNGVVEQDRDLAMETAAEFKTVTDKTPSQAEIAALEFALKICKHTKSNTIVFATADRLLASGTGQTSRVDALRQAVDKAAAFGFSLQGAAMASDAFFPFPDCVELAHQAGITAVVQPGGSIKDQLSIDYCNANNLAMVMTGVRHFKH